MECTKDTQSLSHSFLFHRLAFGLMNIELDAKLKKRKHNSGESVYEYK